MTIFKRFIKFGLIIIVLFLSSIFITYLSLLYKPESIFFIANKTIAKNYSFEYSEINSMGADVYRYLNFHEIASYKLAADNAILPSVTIEEIKI